MRLLYIPCRSMVRCEFNENFCYRKFNYEKLTLQ